MAFTTSKMTIGKTDIDIIKSFPFLYRAMYISPGGILLDKQGIETEFYNAVQPILDQLVKDVQSLSVKAGGRICGQNTKYIIDHLKDEYTKTYNCEIKAIVFYPGQKAYIGATLGDWGMTIQEYDRRIKEQKEKIEWREKLWGVGHTMGVIYHALPLFHWRENEKSTGFYVSVESNLCHTPFMGMTQLHVTRTLDQMKNLLYFRYLARNLQIVDIDIFGKTVDQITGHDEFSEMNTVYYESPYKKKNTIPLKTLQHQRKQTLKEILTRVSKIPIYPRKPLTSRSFFDLGFRGTQRNLRHTLKQQIKKKTPLTRKIRVSKVTLVRKK